MAPGKHIVRFEYIVEGSLSHKSGIFDTFTVWEGRTINTTIVKYTPAKPIRQIAQNKTLRGCTRFQEMTASDTEINFPAMFNGPSYLEFIEKEGLPPIDNSYDWLVVMRWKDNSNADLDLHCYFDYDSNKHIYYSEKELVINVAETFIASMFLQSDIVDINP